MRFDGERPPEAVEKTTEDPRARFLEVVPERPLRTTLVRSDRLEAQDQGSIEEIRPISNEVDAAESGHHLVLEHGRIFVGVERALVHPSPEITRHSASDSQSGTEAQVIEEEDSVLEGGERKLAGSLIDPRTSTRDGSRCRFTNLRSVVFADPWTP